MDHLRAWWLGEMIATAAPLREVMTLFWHGHFTSAAGKVIIAQALYQQNDTLRRHALGNFRKLLGAITLDPAMMIYLDLEDSDKARANENYARELYELFTVGIGQYTEKDIKETARALTGWTLDAPKGTPRKGTTAPGTPRFFARAGLLPAFLPERHDDGTKTVFGQTGRFGLQEVLDLVVRQEALARFLSAKLIAFFGVVDPEGTLRERLAKAFRDGGYEIRPVLKLLFTAPEFYSLASRGSQIKSPVRLLVGAARQLRAEVQATAALAQLTAAMGQNLFDPPNVKGWPGDRAWISAGTLAVRYHLPEVLLDGRLPRGIEPLGRERRFVLSRDSETMRATLERLKEADARQQGEKAREGLKVRFVPERFLPQGVAANPADLVAACLERLVVAHVRPETRSAVINACRAAPVAERLAVAVRLILMSPEYQLA